MRSSPPTKNSKLLPWLIWGMSSLFVTYQMFLQTAPSVMIPDLEKAFSLNTLGVSLLSTCFFYTYVILQIPAGMLIDRIQPRYCLVGCFLLISLTTLIFATTHSLHIATSSRILQGIFSAPSVIPALFLAAILFPSQQFAMLAGLTEMIGMTGSALAQVTLAPALSFFTWNQTLIACAALGLFLAILTWLVIPNISHHKAESRLPKQNIFRDLQIVISCKQAWINGLYAGLLFAIAAAFGSFWCIPFLMKTYKISLNIAAYATSMILFGVAIGAPLLGFISDKIEQRRLPMILSSILVFILLIIILYVPAIPLELMFVLMFSLGFFSSAYALPYAVVRDIMPAHVRGTAMGYTNMMCILIGSPFIQPFIGWVLNHQHRYHITEVKAYHNALSILVICIFISIILALFVEETHCGKK